MSVNKAECKAIPGIYTVVINHLGFTLSDPRLKAEIEKNYPDINGDCRLDKEDFKSDTPDLDVAVAYVAAKRQVDPTSLWSKFTARQLDVYSKWKAGMAGVEVAVEEIQKTPMSLPDLQRGVSIRESTGMAIFGLSGAKSALRAAVKMRVDDTEWPALVGRVNAFNDLKDELCGSYEKLKSYVPNYKSYNDKFDLWAKIVTSVPEDLQNGTVVYLDLFRYFLDYARYLNHTELNFQCVGERCPTIVDAKLVMMCESEF